MGQAASRQAGKAAQRAAKSGGSKAAGSSAPKPRPPPLGRPVADEPEVTEDANKALKQRQQREQQDFFQGTPTSPPPSKGTAGAMPQPDQNTGFFRGQNPVEDPRDVAQEQFLVQQSGGSKKLEEMSPELLKFLKDAGPLQKKVNKVSFVMMI